jgi:hypothetical protein
MTGSAPSVKTSTQPTIDPVQQALLNTLAGGLGTQGLGGTLNFGDVQGQLAGTQYAAPLSGLQQTSLQGMENLVNAYTSGPASAGAAGPLGQATGAVTNATTASPVQKIDASQAFQQGVVAPLTQDFTQSVIPSITGAYGRSAGGAFSSDALGARQQAGTNLSRTLAQQGSQYDLQAQLANQSAEATNAQLQQSAAGLLPRLLGTPGALDLQQQQILSGGLAAGAVPQATQQAQLSGEQSDFQNILTQIQQRLADALGLSTATTQQTTSTVNPGSSGLLAPLISAFAGSAGQGLGAAGGAALGGGKSPVLGGAASAGLVL